MFTFAWQIIESVWIQSSNYFDDICIVSSVGSEVDCINDTKQNTKQYDQNQVFDIIWCPVTKSEIFVLFQLV